MHQAAQHQPVMPEARRVELIRAWTHQTRHSARARLDRLSPRETQVLTALAQGHRVADIATASTVAESTVRTQVKSILAKLGVTSQLAAVALAHDHHRQTSG